MGVDPKKMWEKRIVEDESGHQVDSTVIGVTESTERFSEITLDDGTMLRAKLVVIEACRLDNRWDPATGNPIYLIQSQNIVSVVNAPDELREPRS